MKKRLSQLFHMLSLRTILMIVCSSFILLVVSVSAVFYFTGTKKVQSMIRENAINLTRQATQNMDRNFTQLRQSVASISESYLFLHLNQNIKNNLQPISAKDYTILAEDIQTLVSQNSQNISMAVLMLSDNSIVLSVSNHSNILRYRQPDYRELYSRFSSSNLSWVYDDTARSFLNTSNDVCSIGLLQMLGDENSNLHGLLYIGLSDQAIGEELSHYHVTNSNIFSMVRNGEILFHDPAYIPSQTYDSLTAADLESIRNHTSSLFTESSKPSWFELSDSWAINSPSIIEEVSLIAIFPKSELFLDDANFSSLLLLEAAGSIFLCILLFIAVTKLISAPIDELTRQLDSVDTLSQLKIVHAAGGRDVHLIADAINHLYSRIQNLIQSLTWEIQGRRDAELQALYSQINPHFLYNTLDSIGQLCQLGESDLACKMVSELADFYRIGVSKGEHLIPLKDEFLHVSAYLSILQARYEDFTFHIQLPEELCHVMTPKIILQPLAENALYHGIHTLHPGGTIFLSAAAAGNGDVLITVKDNGIGMDEDTLENIRLSLSSAAPLHRENNGYGLRNVQQRIILEFGTPYGLTIDSRQEEGTTVEIRIPSHPVSRPVPVISLESEAAYAENSFC